eukprot:scaffold297162_cov33-Tisochrysis_lutea.AAC.1
MGLHKGELHNAHATGVHSAEVECKAHALNYMPAVCQSDAGSSSVDATPLSPLALLLICLGLAT